MQFCSTVCCDDVKRGGDYLSGGRSKCFSIRATRFSSAWYAWYVSTLRFSACCPARNAVTSVCRFSSAFTIFSLVFMFIKELYHILAVGCIAKTTYVLDIFFGVCVVLGSMCDAASQQVVGGDEGMPRPLLRHYLLTPFANKRIKPSITFPSYKNP